MYLLVNSAALEMRRRCRLIFRRRGPFFIYLVVCLFPCMAVELLSFWAASIIWHQQQTSTSLDRNSTVILLVADPQLIGHRDEPHWIGWLSRWDADRYLHRGYSHAVGFAPDLEVYLGDLFDEGVHLSDEQFAVEMLRFHGIFPLEMAKNRIYLPGDNDIGGEMEPIYASLFARFRRLFPPKFAPNSTSTALKYLTIFQTNPMKYAEFEGVYGTATNKEENAEGNHGEGSERIRLLLSHAPIVPHMSARVEQELRKIAIVLSAHDHTSALYMQWRQSPAFRKTASAAGADNARWTVSMDDPPAALPLVEFKVPTCSYRMGVPAMGYGLLTLSPFPGNRTAVAHFSVLWLPARYLQLGFYLLMLVVFPFGWALANLAWHCFCRWRRGGGGESQGKKVKMMKRRRKIGEAKAGKKNSADGATTTDEEKHWV